MFIHRLSSVSLLVGLVITATASHLAHGETLLRWKFEQGQKNHLVMVMTQEMQLKMAGQEKQPPMTTTSTMDITFEVTAVDDQDVATLTQTVDRVRMKMQGPQGVMMEYDSQSEAKPKVMAVMMASTLGGMVGRPYTTKMNSRGHIVEINLPQGLAENMGKLPGAQFGNMFSKEGMKGMAEVATLPEEPVNPGDTWIRAATLKNPVTGDMTLVTTFRYVGPEVQDGRELEKIAVEMKTNFGEGGKETVKLTDQSSEGTMYFDNELGQFVASESRSSMKMQISVLGQKMEQKIETNMKAEVVSPKASGKEGD